MYVVNDTVKTIVFRGAVISPYSVKQLSDSISNSAEFIRHRSCGDLKVFPTKMAANMYFKFKGAARFFDKKGLLDLVKDSEVKASLEKLFAANDIDCRKVFRWLKAIKLNCSQINIAPSKEYTIAKVLAGKLNLDNEESNPESVTDPTETKSAESEAVESEAVESEAVESEVVESEAIETSNSEPVAVEETVSETVHEPEVNTEESVLEESGTSTEAVDEPKLEDMESAVEEVTAAEPEKEAQSEVAEDRVEETKPKKKSRKK